MSDLENTKEPKNLPRIVCAFAAFFALGVPGFSVIVGARLQSALSEIVARSVGPFETTSWPVAILDACRVSSWALLIIGLIAAGSLFALMRKNSDAGSLLGAGRITLVLGMTGALSAFYLAALLFAVAFSV